MHAEAEKKESWWSWSWRHTTNALNIFGVPRDKNGEVKPSHSAQITNWLLLGTNCVGSYIWYLVEVAKAKSNDYYGISAELADLIGSDLKAAKDKASGAVGFADAFLQNTGDFPGNYSSAAEPIAPLSETTSLFDFSHLIFWWRLYAWGISLLLLLGDFIRGMHIRHVRGNEYAQGQYLSRHEHELSTLVAQQKESFVDSERANLPLRPDLPPGATAADLPYGDGSFSQQDESIFAVNMDEVFAEERRCLLSFVDGAENISRQAVEDHKNLLLKRAKKYSRSYSFSSFRDYAVGFFTHNNGRIDLPNVSHITIPCIANYILFTLEHLCKKYISEISDNYNELIEEPEHESDNPALLWVLAHASDILSWGSLQDFVLLFTVVLVTVYGADAAAIAATWAAHKLYNLCGDKVHGWLFDRSSNSDEVSTLPEYPSTKI